MKTLTEEFEEILQRSGANTSEDYDHDWTLKHLLEAVDEYINSMGKDGQRK